MGTMIAQLSSGARIHRSLINPFHTRAFTTGAACCCARGFLHAHSDAYLPITIRAVDSDVPYGFTLAGGFQYIHRGLILQTEDEAELAGLLARGIAHTALRFGTVGVRRTQLTQLAMIPLMILGPSAWIGYGTSEGLHVAIPLTVLKYERTAQFDADYFGLQYLHEAGYDPESVIRFLERTSRPTKSSRPKAFNPFPPVSDRVQMLVSKTAPL
jgi:predicted Zn-dependent protease